MSNQDDEHIIGYTSSFSVRPAGLISFHVSSSAPEYYVDFVRLMRRDSRFELADAPVPAQLASAARRRRGFVRTSDHGSYVRVDRLGRLARLHSWTVGCWLRPAKAAADREQVLVGTVSDDGTNRWELYLDEDGHIRCRTAGRAGSATFGIDTPLRDGRWYAVLVSHDADTVVDRIVMQEMGYAPQEVESAGRPLDLAAGQLTMAARASVPKQSASCAEAHFNGRLEDVRIHEVALSTEPATVLVDSAARGLIAWWDFREGMSTSEVRDRGPYGLHGVTVNHPTRAVTGHGWTGRHPDWRTRPEEYGAIHFHEDDVDDVGWPADFDLQVPANLPSGVYGARCTTAAGSDCIPFVVTPGEGRARIVVVLPTYTYQAYANNRVALERDFVSTGAVGRPVSIGPELELLRRHPEWGKSLYDLHADGTGVINSSRLRPIVNMRADYNHWVSGGPRNFSADLCLLAWLDDAGYVVDVITDYEFDAGGLAAIEQYSVVLTGSHPEYCTLGMLDALEAYYHRGGRLMYLGGNGFYWVTTSHGPQAQVIEVRRGYAGTRPWTSEPGEIHHASAGEAGGLWRHRGRPPNALVGIGFTSQGWDQQAGYYRRTEAASDERYRWIFDGVPDGEVIGNFGLIMGGAAGDEIDRHDPDLGGDDAVVLATSEGHSENYCVAVEELSQTSPFVTGPVDGRVRSDIVYRDNENGGAIFSVGSMCWVGGLVVDKRDNNVSRVTSNVLDRFARGAPPRG
jgi:N,N-dimethylformamidase